MTNSTHPRILRVALLDDHQLVQQGLSALLRQAPWIYIVGIHDDSRQLIDTLSATPVDIVLIDYSLAEHDVDGLRLIRLLRQRYPAIGILVISAHDHPITMRLAIAAGANGFFPKRYDTQLLLSAIETIVAGGIYLPDTMSDASCAGSGPAQSATSPLALPAGLTRREIEVLRCCLEGMSVTAIAAKYSRSLKTISTQKSSACRKLGIGNDTELFKHGAELSQLLNASEW